MAKNRNVSVVLILVAAGAAWGMLTREPMVSAQQRNPSDQARVDLNAALLAEVRGLRADLAQASQTGVRAQLLMARVQLQEQRVMYFDRRRAELATRTADASDKRRQAEVEVKDAEERLRQIRSGNPQIGGFAAVIPKEQLAGLAEMFEEQVKKLKADVQTATEVEQRLQIEEADVLSVLSAEQGRWNDFNARLDELERALPK